MKLLRLILLYPIFNIITLAPCLSESLHTSSSDGPASCKGRLKLNGTTGYITSGSIFYSINLQCIWLIDSGKENATITLQIHRFNTECNYDYLYIFDGDSIYSPMVAALSGDIKDFNTNSVNNYEKFSGSHKISYQPRFESVSQNNHINNIRNYNNNNNNINNNNNNLNNNTSDSNIVGPNIYTTIATASLNNKNTDVNNSVVGNLSNQYGRSTTSSLLPSWYHSVPPEPFEITTYSGKAFIYFHSDTAQSMPGFYMTYSVNSISCPDCNDHGECDKETLMCKCNSGYHGPQCQFVDCPNNCTTSKHGSCDKDKNCICNEGFQGQDCSSIVKAQTWRSLNRDQRLQQQQQLSTNSVGRAQHQAVLIGNQLWVLGGRTKLTSDTNLTIFKKRKSPMIMRFDLDEKRWSNVTIEGVTGIDHLAEVTGHSSVGYNNKIYSFGGLALNYTILDSLTVFDTITLSTTTISPNKDSRMGDKPVGPIASVGHSANLVNNHMYIFLGFNPSIGYLNYVQKYSLIDGRWSLIERRGSPLSGCIGHTTTYDPVSEQVYLYGGHDAQRLNNMYLFDIQTESWFLLQPGPSPRYYHSALIVDRQLIILGGNSYNTSFHSDQCFQDSYLTFDLNCSVNNVNIRQHNKEFLAAGGQDAFLKFPPGRILMETETCEADCWNVIKNTNQPGILRSHGQSVVNYNRSLVLHGGFNGMLMADLFVMPIGTCSSILEESDCNRQKLVLECAWDMFESKCENRSEMLVNSSLPSSTATSTATSSQPCVKYSESDIVQSIQNQDMMLDESSCNKRASCNECVSSRCIWCSSSEQCLDSTAYFAYHSIGQCMHYVAHPNKCVVASCTDLESCDTCLANPKCGWLNDIGNTGKGKCLEGTSRGPLFGRLSDDYDTTSTASGSNASLSTDPFVAPPASELSMISRFLSSISSSSTTTSKPPQDSIFAQQQYQLNNNNLPNWHYASCPACQCNGHSYCKANSSICAQPCQDNTEGHQCERCLSGFHGDPQNGGVCKPCKCNGHAQACNKETGKCYCHTKGIIGHQCSRCDEQNHYIGDPLNPHANGTCYYNLTTDFQYTFNMSKPEDHYYSDINFINNPTKRESDVDFTITCSKPALVNITSGVDNKYRRPIYTERECGTIRLRLSPDRNDLVHDQNFSYFVHVHKFQTPFVFQVSFSQHRTIYLPQVFFTFSSCFLFFFMLSGILWKVKVEYDNYVRRQRQTIELQQMASRPFSRIFLEMFETTSWKSGMSKVPTSDPTPISFEPCFGDNIGVLSVFVQLPGGRPNLAVGSALVNLTEPVEDQVGSANNNDRQSNDDQSNASSDGSSSSSSTTTSGSIRTSDSSTDTDDNNHISASTQSKQQQPQAIA